MVNRLYTVVNSLYVMVNNLFTIINQFYVVESNLYNIINKLFINIFVNSFKSGCEIKQKLKKLGILVQSTVKFNNNFWAQYEAQFSFYLKRKFLKYLKKNIGIVKI